MVKERSKYGKRTVKERLKNGSIILLAEDNYYARTARTARVALVKRQVE